MGETVEFESREMIVDKAIDDEVDRFLARDDGELPKIGDAITGHFVKKIEGRYDVERSKLDTDNVIDLLYIAYNTTPQARGENRVAISDIMGKLVRAQQDSEAAMKRAKDCADYILEDMPEGIYADWCDARQAPEDKRAAAVKAFLGDDMQDFVTEVAERAAEVRDDLNKIAETYDGIINDTQAATSASEVALSEDLEKKAQIEEEITKANAEREKLDSLVTDLQAEVDKYDKMARDFGARADTAEERAFIMSIVRVAADVLSAAIPPLVMAASGPGSILAASAAGASDKALGKDDSASAGDGDTTEEAIAKKKELSDKKAELDEAEKAKEEIEERIDELETEKSKLTGKKKGEGDGAEPPPRSRRSTSASTPRRPTSRSRKRRSPRSPRPSRPSRDRSTR